MPADQISDQDMLHPQQDALVTSTTGVNYHLLQGGLTAQASALENGESATSPMTAQTAHPCLDEVLLSSDLEKIRPSRLGEDQLVT